MSNPIKTGLVSYGMSGRVFHGPLLKASKQFLVSAILERSRDDSRQAFPGARRCRSAAELLSDPGLELIVVNSPDHTHYELAREALRQGKHVVVEKPFTQTTDQARELIRQAEKSGLVLSVFHNRRWDSDFLTVKQVLEQGWLGRLVSYEAHFNRFRPEPARDTWKEDPGLGSGTLYNLGSHLIDQALLLFGMPAGVTADIRTMREGGRVDDTFDLWLTYPRLRVRLCGSYLVREPGPKYILHGTQGSFLKRGADPQENALAVGLKPAGLPWRKEHRRDWGLLHTGLEGKVVREPFPSQPGNYPRFYENIHEAIRHGKPLEVTAGQAADVVRIVEAAFESHRRKKTMAP